jgi:two-component sensor histidine kinase/PAS domain-containing protein
MCGQTRAAGNGNLNERTSGKADIAADTTDFLRGGGDMGAFMRARDWSTSELGKPSTWPHSLRTVVEILLAGGFPMIALWGPNLVQIYNDGYRRIMGERHPAGLGQPTRECWPEVWHINEPIYARILGGESVTFEDALYPITRHGIIENAWFTLSYSPLRDDQGAIAGVLVTVFETTGRMLADLRLAAERERQRRQFEQAPGFIAISTGPEHIYEFGNEAYARLVGRCDFVGKTVRDVSPDIEGQGFYELLDDVYATGKRYVAKHVRVRMQRTFGADPEDRYVDFIYEPVIDEMERVVGVFTQGHDVTEAHLAQEALRESEEFNRRVLESSSDCIKVLDLDANLVFMSEGGQRLMEVSDFNTIRGCPWPDFWESQGNADAKAAVAAARAGGVGHFQGAASTMAGTAKFWDVKVTAILSADGHPERLLSVSRDVTETRRAEEQRVELTRELAHRMKNTLAMVQAIATQTFRQVRTVEEGRDALTSRLAALSAAQDILTQTDWKQASIRTVVGGAVAPHRTKDGRISIMGPDLSLTSQQGLGLSLALHELATNATKYGALSNEDGHVAIGWTVSPDGAFSFEWIESEGPTVEARARSGFGSRFLERIVGSYFAGKTRLSFDHVGVTFRLVGLISDDLPQHSKLG